MENGRVKNKKNTCAVAICPSPKDEQTIYHRFPKSDDLKKKWIVACRRDDRILNPKTSLICSRHFLPTDYERDLEHELLGLPPRKFLKKDAVPSRKLRYEEKENQGSKSASSNRQRLQQKRERQQIVSQLLREDTSGPANAIPTQEQLSTPILECQPSKCDASTQTETLCASVESQTDSTTFCKYYTL